MNMKIVLLKLTFTLLFDDRDCMIAALEIFGYITPVHSDACLILLLNLAVIHQNLMN
jgi:hypothetical protein